MKRRRALLTAALLTATTAHAQDVPVCRLDEPDPTRVESCVYAPYSLAPLAPEPTVEPSTPLPPYSP